MTMTGGAEREGFEDCEDRSLYFTLSLYVTAAKAASVLGRALDAETLRSFQLVYRDSVRLRNAVEPLFNDIADRERLGAVDDFLLDTLCPRGGEFVEFQSPDEIEWMTEGRRFIATPPGLGQTRLLRVRRFWYAHSNGALSYHLSFRYNYGHTPGEFYFLSLIQKLAAPKEFAFVGGKPRIMPMRVTEETTGLAPLDAIKVSRDGGRAISFWHHVRDAFDADASDLFGALRAMPDMPRIPGKLKPDFGNLVSEAPFIEVPGLIMPVSRLLFFFEDCTFFRRLLPPPDPQTGRPIPRTLMVQEGCYLPIQQKLQGLNPKTSVDVPEIHLDTAYWNWIINRPDYDQFTDAQIEAARTAIPAMEDRRRQDCLQYLFVAGFNQNIIDFMNQEPSEILDSTDPIYPATEEQAMERKFARYAHPRALITYVEKSRSLEAANDYIGTCPYAFMVHVVSMHNEFMTREYESSAFEVIKRVEALGNKGRLKEAAEAFYAFRTGDYAAFYRDRYMNVFRYDTESEVFEKMTELRGISRRSEYIERLISNMESQTRDREARINKRDENAMNLLLGALGLFGFFQLTFQWSTTLSPGSGILSGEPSIDWRPPFVHLPGVDWSNTSELIAGATFYLSAAFSVVLLGYVVWRVFRSLRP